MDMIGGDKRDLRGCYSQPIIYACRKENLPTKDMMVGGEKRVVTHMQPNT